MNMPNIDQIKRDIQALAAQEGWSVNRLARISDVEQGSLSRFLRGKQKTLHLKTLSKLWPFLYGDINPSDMQAENHQDQPTT